MRKGLIEVSIIVMGLLANITAVSAQVNHVSINSRQFELNSVPRLKVNVVAQNDDVSQLVFYIRQRQDGEIELQTLTVTSINHFLLQLNGSRIISDPQAQLVITEDTETGAALLGIEAVFAAPFTVNSATLVAEVENQAALPGASHSVVSVASAEQHAPASRVSTASTRAPTATSQAPTATSQASRPTASIMDSAQQATCLIERDNSDTLWGIANRYKEQWHTSIYGAMLAIFEVNLRAFSKQNIHLLHKDVPLHCPSAAVLAEYNNKEVDRKVFEAIEATPTAQ